MGRVLVRALAVWAVLMGAEVAQGTLRVFVVAPTVGDFRARQLVVVSGSLVVTVLFAGWLEREAAP